MQTERRVQYLSRKAGLVTGQTRQRDHSPVVQPDEQAFASGAPEVVLIGNVPTAVLAATSKFRLFATSLPAGRGILKLPDVKETARR